MSNLSGNQIHFNFRIKDSRVLLENWQDGNKSYRVQDQEFNTILVGRIGKFMVLHPTDSPVFLPFSSRLRTAVKRASENYRESLSRKEESENTSGAEKEATRLYLVKNRLMNMDADGKGTREYVKFHALCLPQSCMGVSVMEALIYFRISKQDKLLITSFSLREPKEIMVARNGKRLAHSFLMGGNQLEVFPFESD